MRPWRGASYKAGNVVLGNLRPVQSKQQTVLLVALPNERPIKQQQEAQMAVQRVTTCCYGFLAKGNNYIVV